MALKQILHMIILLAFIQTAVSLMCYHCNLPNDCIGYDPNDPYANIRFCAPTDALCYEQKIDSDFVKRGCGTFENCIKDGDCRDCSEDLCNDQF